jgi:hypothetical protein
MDDYHHKPPEPSSYMPPTSVVRGALGWTIPFAIAWAIGGAIGWTTVVNTVATAKWPPFLLSMEFGAVVVLASAVAGAICAVGLRLFLWTREEWARARSNAARTPRVIRQIKTDEQDWGGADMVDFKE